jgi:hypothetical protein
MILLGGEIVAALHIRREFDFARGVTAQREADFRKYIRTGSRQD